MPRRRELPAEAILHIASGEIGIHAAKKKYGIGESRVLRIRQGLEVASPDRKDQQDEEARETAEQVEKDRDDALQALAQEKQRVATLEGQNEQLRESLAESRVFRIRKGLEVALEDLLPTKKDDALPTKKDDLLPTKKDDALPTKKDKDWEAALQAIAHRISIFDLQE